jgi:PAS domain S-box-containing protein
MVDLHDFVDGGCVGLRWIGDDGIVMWANRADYEQLGYAQDEFIGQPMRDFFAEPTQADALMAQLLAGASIRSYPVQLRCRDGALRSVSI